MRVMFFGEKAEKSAPSLSTAEVLRARGQEAIFEEPLTRNALDWVRLLRSVDMAVCTFYGPGQRTVRRITTQCKLAAVLGTPLVRWWVGTDAWNALRDRDILRHARALDHYVCANVAVSPNIRDELAQLGIVSRVIVRPLPYLPQDIDTHWDMARARSILVYLPADRPELYGAQILDALIPARQDLTFYLVADDGARYRDAGNVVSLGWLEDMEEAYRRTGCLLRIREHDGLSRMVREALARGLYVIWSEPLETCILARTYGEVDAALSTVADKAMLHHEGIELSRRMHQPQLFMEQFTALVEEVSTRQWTRAAAAMASLVLGLSRGWLRVLPELSRKGSSKEDI